eukprot:sb/3464616/
MSVPFTHSLYNTLEAPELPENIPLPLGIFETWFTDLDMFYNTMEACHHDHKIIEPRCSKTLTVTTSIVLAFLVLLTAITNIITLRAFLKMKHSANNTFFINLALVYTLVAVVVQPFSMYLVGVQTLQEPLPSIAAVLCQITGAIFEVAIYTSLFSLTSISLDRYAIVFHPLKYKCQINRNKVLIWNGICWLCVCFMIIPVATSFAVSTTTIRIFSTHNSTTVCQGRYWFMISHPHQDPEQPYSRDNHIFIYLLASIYIAFFCLSLAPNLAVIAKLNRSNYKLESAITNSLPSHGPPSRDGSHSSLTDLPGEELSTTPTSLVPSISSCYEGMKAVSPSSPLIERPAIPGARRTASSRKNSALVSKSSSRKSLSTPALKLPTGSAAVKRLSFADMPKSILRQVEHEKEWTRSELDKFVVGSRDWLSEHFAFSRSKSTHTLLRYVCYVGRIPA